MSFFFFKQKTAYEMRISDWSSDVCSSDLANLLLLNAHRDDIAGVALGGLGECADICHVDFLSGSRTRDNLGLDGDGKAASRNSWTRSAETHRGQAGTACFCLAGKRVAKGVGGGRNDTRRGKQERKHPQGKNT